MIIHSDYSSIKQRQRIPVDKCSNKRIDRRQLHEQNNTQHCWTQQPHRRPTPSGVESTRWRQGPTQAWTQKQQPASKLVDNYIALAAIYVDTLLTDADGYKLGLHDDDHVAGPINEMVDRCRHQCYLCRLYRSTSKRNVFATHTLPTASDVTHHIFTSLSNHRFSRRL